MNILLRGSLLDIVLDPLAVGLEGADRATRQLVYLLVRDPVALRRMELDLLYLVDVARALRIEDLLAVPADQMPPDHALRRAHQLEKVAVE